MESNDVVDVVFRRYRRLTQYYSRLYGKLMHVDPEDLYQDGCLRLVKRCRKWSTLPSQHDLNSFRRSIGWHVLKRANAIYRKNAKTCRLDYGYEPDQADSGCSINLSEIVACVEPDVLSKIYAREFLAELRRILSARYYPVLDYMLLDNKVGWVTRAATFFNVRVTKVWRHTTHIRRTARNILARAS